MDIFTGTVYSNKTNVSFLLFESVFFFGISPELLLKE